MMSEAKPFASLSSGLLARKGAAKPAMRPQAFGQVGASLEDLGWNDMGHGGYAPQPEPYHEEPLPEHVPSSIAALTPAPKSIDAVPQAQEVIAEPPVTQQQRVIAETFGKDPEPEVVPAPRRKAKAAVVPLRKGPREAERGAKAAFTLRLDPERHLRLRLACAVTSRSAQQMVTEAVDQLLKSIPEIEALAGQVPAKSVSRN